VKGLRKEIQVRLLDNLIDALTRCGYKQDRRRKYSFRKGKFHFILRFYRDKVVIHLHKNSKFHITPARLAGKDLEAEFNKVMAELRRETSK